MHTTIVNIKIYRGNIRLSDIGAQAIAMGY